MTRFVPPPTVVSKPPNAQANASGIKSAAESYPRVRAQSLVTGMRSARMGVLLQNADMETPLRRSRRNPERKLVSRPKTLLAALSASLELSTEATTTNNAPMASTPGLLKPDSASAVEMIPAFHTTSRDRNTWRFFSCTYLLRYVRLMKEQARLDLFACLEVSTLVSCRGLAACISVENWPLLHLRYPFLN